MLAWLIGLMVLVPEGDPRGDTAAVLSLSCGTDNQGNSHLLDRLLTTKYPLGIVLMELAHQMRVRRLVLRAHWLPRLENEEADALTNEDFRHFKAEHRVQVDLNKMGFAVLDSLFKVGEDYMAALESAKTEAKKQSARAEEKKATKKLRGQLRGVSVSRARARLTPAGKRL